MKVGNLDTLFIGLGENYEINPNRMKDGINRVMLLGQARGLTNDAEMVSRISFESDDVQAIQDCFRDGLLDTPYLMDFDLVNNDLLLVGIYETQSVYDHPMARQYFRDACQRTREARTAA